MIASVRALWARARALMSQASTCGHPHMCWRAGSSHVQLPRRPRWSTRSSSILGLGTALQASLLHLLAAEVHLSDLVPNVLSNLRHNVMLNQERASVQWRAPSVELIDWQDSTTWPQSGSADLVLGADLVYDDGVADLLANVLAHMLKEGGEFVHVRPERGRTGASELTAALVASGLALVEEQLVPPSRRVHDNRKGRHSMWHVFNEVGTKPFVLQRYQKMPC